LTVHGILDAPTKEKLSQIKVRRTRWPSDRPAPANPFLRKFAISEVFHFLVKLRRLCVLMERLVIGTPFFGNRHEEFLGLRRHFKKSEGRTSGGKIWHFKWHEL
jgi:hypothetical protein